MIFLQQNYFFKIEKLIDKVEFPPPIMFDVGNFGFPIKSSKDRNSFFPKPIISPGIRPWIIQTLSPWPLLVSMENNRWVLLLETLQNRIAQNLERLYEHDS